MQSPQQFFIIIEEQIIKDISAAEIRNAEIRAYLKNHSRNLHAPLCGIFCPNSVAVARYGAFIRTKSPTNCDAHLAESLFQTRSNARNAAARGLYKKLGYKGIGIVPTEFNGIPDVQLVLLEKHL